MAAETGKEGREGERKARLKVDGGRQQIDVSVSDVS